ncbi:hypothetical protein VNI00_011970 [Paramarasmius palmivorus]|uniref:RING-type domain-containing protein n=1 Tax=Paramarasmius palmivorus TaxID=297713 RepID=A0AAW0C8H0_9AGAR
MATNNNPARRTNSLRTINSETQAVARPSSGKASKNKSKGKTSTKTRVIDVIEISSDEDEPVAPLKRRNDVGDLERQVKKLKEVSTLSHRSAVCSPLLTVNRRFKENEGLKKKQRESEDAIARYKQDISELRSELKGPESTSGTLSTGDLEDYISCEICENKLWTPYILPGCGHAFCKNCLQEWFDTTRNKALAQGQNNPFAHLPEQIRLVVQQNPNLADLVMAQYGYPPPPPPPTPQYTCPSCRTPVSGRPVEDFALKSIVRLVAKAQGETSPKKVPNNRGRGRGPPVAEDPWARFFPRA